MDIKREPKYDIIDGQLCNRHTGEPIPADEPVFILRARDKFAVGALKSYLRDLPVTDHISSVRQRISDFIRFSLENPGRMKAPDTHPAVGAPPVQAPPPTLADLKAEAYKCLREAEAAWYAYYGAADVGDDRTWAAETYEKIRTAPRRF